MKFLLLIAGVAAFLHLVCGEIEIAPRMPNQEEPEEKPEEDADYEACEEANDCGNEDGFCGSADYYASCSPAGACYCTNPQKSYDGVSPPKESQMKCKESTGDQPCAKTCADRKTVLTTKGKAYTCDIGGTTRCFCSFKTKSNLSPCKKDEDCNANNCNSAPVCKTGKSVMGLYYPDVCDCADGIKSTNCKEDSYCRNTCAQAAGGSPGKACPAKDSGKGQCVCDSS